MKKFLKKAIPFVIILTALVSCFVVPSFAFEHNGKTFKDAFTGVFSDEACNMGIGSSNNVVGTFGSMSLDFQGNPDYLPLDHALIGIPEFGGSGLNFDGENETQVNYKIRLTYRSGADFDVYAFRFNFYYELEDFEGCDNLLEPFGNALKITADADSFVNITDSDTPLSFDLFSYNRDDELGIIGIELSTYIYLFVYSNYVDVYNHSFEGDSGIDNTNTHIPYPIQPNLTKVDSFNYTKTDSNQCYINIGLPSQLVNPGVYFTCNCVRTGFHRLTEEGALPILDEYDKVVEYNQGLEDFVQEQAAAIRQHEQTIEEYEAFIDANEGKLNNNAIGSFFEGMFRGVKTFFDSFTSLELGTTGINLGSVLGLCIGAVVIFFIIKIIVALL